MGVDEKVKLSCLGRGGGNVRKERGRKKEKKGKEAGWRKARGSG
jgi:hypothetical protein